ncbi:serine hydrolase domain-containing protein [Candidatus Leptofilum sp.]|uniref:serine hydrolase domain-containing protein n=1 Tax=Candidatus Leptofilum sp. TaxID=3241576 RepID=UPI003B5CCE70
MTFLVILLTVALISIIVYRRDPWLWRRFFGLFQHMNDPGHIGLQPTETVPSPQPIGLLAVNSAKQTINKEALQAVQRYAASFESYALLVLHRGVIQAEWYSEGRSASSLTQSQSMHKTVLPILLHSAIAEGHISSLDASIGQFIHEWQADARGEITIRQMLMMSSGLDQYGFSFNPFSNDFRWLFSGNTLPFVLAVPLAYEPGSQFDYNNLNSYLLGLLLERATGQRYAAYLAEKLWQPLCGSMMSTAVPIQNAAF